MKILRKKTSMSLIPLPSMADIAFLLLIFFMVSSILEMEKEIPINLPESRISMTESTKYMNVWMNPAGDTFVNGEKVKLEKLYLYAKYKVTANPDVKALISADRSLPFKYVNSVMEVMRDAGIYNIVFVSKKKKKE